MVYVTPSPGMVVRAGQHVSGEGKVYHPYLAQWGEVWDKSNVADFLAILIEIFAKEPPVVARQSSNQLATPVRRDPTPPPVPPLPPQLELRPHQHTPSYDTIRAEPTPPPPPPKPFSVNRESHPRQSWQTSVEASPPPRPIQPATITDSFNTQVPPSHDHPLNSTSSLSHKAQYLPQRTSSLSQYSRPPLPPHSHRPHYQQPDQDESYSPVSPLSPEEQLPRHSFVSHRIPRQPQHAEQPQLTVYESPQYTYREPRAQVNHGQQRQPQAQQPLSAKVKPPQPAEDLLSSPVSLSLPSQADAIDNAPAPPIPPNPEKDALLAALSTAVRQHIQQSITQSRSAFPSLQAQQHALQQATVSLNHELQQLRALDQMLSSNERILHESMQEADRMISSTGSRSVPRVDDVLVAPTIVGGQLYELCAEEGAIGDALFVLGRGLDKGRIRADSFIKMTRGLARERFLKKALIRKISKGMGLA